MEVVSTILSKENLSEVILQSLDPESRRNLISRFVLRDPDREILLRKEAGEQGDCAHTNTQGDSAHTNTQGDSAHTNTQGESREECLVSGESCHNENGLVSQKPYEKEQGQISEESCEEECTRVSQESSEEKSAKVSEESCEEEHIQVCEESCEEESVQVSEESCEEEHAQVSQESCEEEHAEVSEVSCEAKHGLISKETEENTDTAKHDCIMSHNSSPILPENQQNKDLGCYCNELKEGFIDETENVESESGKENVKEIHSTSDTKTLTENVSNTDISETEVYEDEEDDWGSDWDDEEEHEYESHNEVNNKSELLERNDYKVQTFSGSFCISVSGE